MSLFKIRIKAGTPAAFDPNPLKVNVNDSASWSNDDKVAHWPAPSAANPKGWLDYQIAPGGESGQISFDPPGPYTLNYVCALHPGEKGQIKVLGAKKRAYGGKTKKGAFGKTTK
jgi:plastocyanin